MRLLFELALIDRPTIAQPVVALVSVAAFAGHLPRPVRGACRPPCGAAGRVRAAPQDAFSGVPAPLRSARPYSPAGARLLLSGKLRAQRGWRRP